MRFIYSALLVFVFLGCSEDDVAPCGVAETSSAAAQSPKVLFIGNSQTFWNDLPISMLLMAYSSDDDLIWQMSAPGGFDFKRHSTLSATILAIESEQWDYVVLQSSTRSALKIEEVETLVFPYAEVLNQMIKDNNSKTKVLLYLPQAYKAGALTFDDVAWCADDPLVCDYGGMQERIRETYLEMSDLLDATVAPSGMISKIFQDANPEIELFDVDKVHPSPNGSYLAACTLYSFIYKKRPIGLYVPDDVTPATAEKIQTTVSGVLFDCSYNWKEY